MHLAEKDRCDFRQSDMLEAAVHAAWCMCLYLSVYLAGRLEPFFVCIMAVRARNTASEKDIAKVLRGVGITALPDEKEYMVTELSRVISTYRSTW